MTKKILLVTGIVLPVVLVSIYSYLQIRRDTLEQIYTRGSAISSLSAHVLKERLDRLVDVGISLATRPVLEKYIEEGKWKEAIELLREVHTNFGYIDRLFVTDTIGTLLADLPTDPQMHGRNFANSLWFPGVSKSWKPYFSEVYKRDAQPRIVVASLAVPIRSKNQTVRGILVLQIRMSKLLEWSNRLNIGKSDFIYILDQKGHLAINPEQPGADSIVDYSMVPAIQRALKGVKSIGVSPDPIARQDRLSAYEQIPGYGWVVLFEQKASAGLILNSGLGHIIIFYSFVILLSVGMGWFAIYMMSAKQKDEESMALYAGSLARAEKLELQQSLFAAIINYSEDAIISKSLDGVITSWNRGAERLFGYSGDEAIGRNVSMLIPRDRLNEEPEIIEKIKRGQHVDHYETERVKQDGSVVFISLTVSPVKNKAGEIIGASKIARDISERKKAEAELLIKEERFRALLEGMSEAFISLDNDLCYTYVNKKAGEIINKDPQWLIGKKVEDIFPNAESAPIYKGLQKALASRKHLSITTHDESSDLWHEIHFYPLQQGVSLFVRDISERKKAERKLMESEQRFRALIEHSAEGIALTDEHANIIYRSPGVQKITGGLPEERRKETIGYTHPDDQEMMKSKFKEALLNPGLPIPFQGRFQHVLGHYYWMEGTLTNLQHIKGVNALVTNFRDITERKKSEQLLLESNERYEMVSKATSDAIWDWDIGSDSTTWNYGLQKLFGYMDKQIADSSKWWEDKIHPDDHDRVWVEIEKAFHEQRELWISSYRYKTSAGIYRHVFDRASIIYKDSKPTRMIGAMQDVDEQVKTLEEVKRLSIVASKTDNSVLILDKNVRIEWANESFTRLSGYTLEEAIGQKPFELLHGTETDPGEKARIIKKTLLLKPFTDEILNYAKNGRKYWVRITVTPVFNEHGELDKFVTIQSDITDKKEFERSLTTIARELTGFIENANATIFGVDRNGYINEWNKVTAEISGFEKKDVLGKRWVDFLRPEKKADVSGVLAKIFAGESIDNYELPIVNKKGDNLILSISISPRLDVNKNIAGAICVGQDVTEIFQYRQNLERMVEDRTRDLNEALKKEKELVEMKSKFVSIASHEFRTPLATIRFAVDSMRNYTDKLSKDEIQKKLIKIQDQAVHMNSLLEDILTIGKSEARKIKVVLSEINLKEFVGTLVEEVRATQKESRVVAFTFSGTMTKVNMDDKLLRNIIINLLTNAIKFSETSSTVKIMVTYINASVLIEVTDQGVGIKEEELSSIFESFQRGSNVSTVQGTGLGLSIVKKAVDLLGGSIQVESVLHQGSKFVVKLPAK